jgi:hypothetical protein
MNPDAVSIRLLLTAETKVGLQCLVLTKASVVIRLFLVMVAVAFMGDESFIGQSLQPKP